MADPSSNANIEHVRISHMHLEWAIDFDAKTISGAVTHSAKNVTGADELVLDATPALANSVKTSDVTVDGEAAEVAIGAVRGALGLPLRVKLPEAKRVAGAEFEVRLPYTVGTEATALQFLDKEQTADKTHPYLFTQCQAIHARSLLPCQDAPGAKVTYSAAVTVAKPLTALMSALRDGDPVDNGDTRTFKFKQPVAMSTYLVALACGLLESRDVGPRTTVWSEPSMVEAAAYEFAETEQFVAAAENLLTPYVWGRYDLLCLPPSFPYVRPAAWFVAVAVAVAVVVVVVAGVCPFMSVSVSVCCVRLCVCVGGSRGVVVVVVVVLRLLCYRVAWKTAGALCFEGENWGEEEKGLADTVCLCVCVCVCVCVRVCALCVCVQLAFSA